VNGENTRPTYRFLKSQGVLGTVSWNFQGRFVVDKEGNGMEFFIIYDAVFVNAFSELVVSIGDDNKVEEKIDEYLKK
jgi:glutathione peroxidase-family protein